MKVIYVTQQGSVIGKTSRRLRVSKKGKTLAEVSVIGLDGVVLFGNVQVTSQAVGFLLDNQIQLSFLSSKGKYRGTLVPAQSKNVLLRVAQYERYLDEEFQRLHASVIVKAKLKSAKSLMNRHIKNHPELDFQMELSALDSALKELEKQPPISGLLGIEGQATAKYFRAFGKMVRGEFSFSSRSRRPPKDPVNALLSFGYTLVTNEIFSLLLATGFDPYIGYLHGIEYGRPSLALDMVEEFRHSLVDRFTLYLINNRIISAADFAERDDGGFFLEPASLKKYFEEYEKRMNHFLLTQETDREVSYRQILRRQVRKLSKTIQTGVPYDPWTGD